MQPGMYVNLLLVTSAIYVAMIMFALTRRKTAAGHLFIGIMTIAAVWALAYYLELVSDSIATKKLWIRIRFLFLPFLSLFWLSMVQQLTGRGRWLTRPVWVALTALAVTTVVIIQTMDWHPWFWTDFTMQEEYGMHILQWQRHGWDTVLQLYQNLLSIVSLVMLLRAWSGAAPVQRRQIILLVLSFVLPMAVNMLFVVGHSPLPHINLGPFTMIISGLLTGWALFGYHALDVVPVARDAVIEQLPDWVVVLDQQGLVVDMNQSAAAGMGVSATHGLGQPASALPLPWRQLFENRPATESSPMELLVGGQSRWYERVFQDLSGRRQPMGTLCRFRDVTALTRAQQALRSSEEELRLILDNIAEAVYVHDDQGVILAVNKPALRMFHMPDEQTARRFDLFRDYSAPDYTPAETSGMRSLWARVLAGERVVIPHWRSRRPLDGSLLDMQIILQRIHRGKQALILATAMDISEHLARERESLEMEKLRSQRQLVDQQRRLLSDMHDGIGGIAANIAILANLGQEEDTGAAKNRRLESIENLAAEGNAEIRSLMNALEHPDYCWPDWLYEVRKYGKTACEGHGVEFRPTVMGAPYPSNFSLPAGISLLRVIKEGIANAVKHAQATQLHLQVEFAADHLGITLQDDGVGFNPTRRATGRGMQNIRRRVEELGGSFEIRGQPGTRLTLRIPVPIIYPTGEVAKPG